MVAMLRDRCALERERMQRWGSDAFGEIEAYADLGSGSDRTGAPAGIVTELRPPNVTAWIEPGLPLVELFGAATVPEPIRRGAEPYSFERRMQIWARWFLGTLQLSCHGAVLRTVPRLDSARRRTPASPILFNLSERWRGARKTGEGVHHRNQGD